MSEQDLEPALESDAVGRVPAEAHESIVRAPELTPDERAQDAELALYPRRKWRRIHAGIQLGICPLCGSVVPFEDHRARHQHVEHHKRLELAAAACGLPPGHVVLSVDYASLAERARHHSHIAVAVSLVLMFITAVVIVISVL